jgi:S1-C subfamily serine protease
VLQKKVPSDKAGIKAGDIILEFNGTKIKRNERTYQKLLLKLKLEKQ